ncbi:MAG: AAC(3) family N-acetyltransferase [Solobacterium sp.]|nr:AAC(3) family N-acetyltransferase [Solobacterium sp.]MBR3202022.1 AAC(3) family N-acetyltransferase [Solobacterium sp.]
MSQKETNKIESVVSKETLIKALRYVGLGQNMNVEVHASLSSLGYLTGGARTVVDALMEIITEGGTILMPTQTTDNTDPSTWVNPPASPSVWDDIRDNMPAYNPETSDLCCMGRVAENFRHRPGVISSNHPTTSFAAWGRYARVLCNRQSLHFPLAEESPVARLYELKGHVLLIGVDFTKATCLHLAEYRTECRPIIVQNACTLIDGRRGWKKYLDLDINSDDFEKIKPEMDRKNLIRETVLNGCRIQLFPVNAAVDEATAFFEKNVVYDLYR